MYHIQKTPDYLILHFSGQVDLGELLAAVKEEMTRADYPDSNDIYALDGAIFAVSQEEFAILLSAVRRLYPSGAKRTKTAFVARSELVQAMANLWAAEAQKLPFQSKSFGSLVEAERWLAE